MKRLFALGVAACILSGCTTTERYAGGGAVVGAIAGSAIGAGVGGSQGALVGGAIGAAGGAVAGVAVAPGPGPYLPPRQYDPAVVYYPSAPSDYDKQCQYRDSFGTRYLAACPRGYPGHAKALRAGRVAPDLAWKWPAP